MDLPALALTLTLFNSPPAPLLTFAEATVTNVCKQRGETFVTVISRCNYREMGSFFIFFLLSFYLEKLKAEGGKVEGLLCAVCAVQ
jgi:hypothetical protein